MIFAAEVEWIGLGFLFGAGVWCACWCLMVLRRTFAISMDVSDS